MSGGGDASLAAFGEWFVVDALPDAVALILGFNDDFDEGEGAVSVFVVNAPPSTNQAGDGHKADTG